MVKFIMTIYINHTINEDGWTDWIRPIKKGYKLACCDCGLVHDIGFRIRQNHVEFKAKRNNRATAAKRRSLKNG